MPQWKPDRDLSGVPATDLAYAAGIIDGEGCIHIARTKNPQMVGGIVYFLLVRVGTTDGVIPQHLLSIFGGSIVNRHRRQQVWQATGAHAEAVLLAVLPYLVLKKPQAELALEFRETFGSPGPGLTDDVRDLRQDLYERLRGMKTRGKEIARV